MKNYLSLKSLSEADFAEKRDRISKNTKSTLTSSEDMRRIERLLDLKEGILGDVSFFLTPYECQCGRMLSFYDFIFSALVEQWHDPSFIVHTLVGNKYFVNEPRPIRCSNCGRSTNWDGTLRHECGYETDSYGCCEVGPGPFLA